MLYETTRNYKLYGKTGGGNCDNSKVTGWYVGFVETGGNNYIFAMNLFVNNYKELNTTHNRIGLTKRILTELDVIF